jgi:SpoVK/Ycf46/Vps4 family AAA+-type ATPase
VHIDVGFPDAAAREAIVLDTLKSIPLDYTQDSQLPDAHAVAAFAAMHTSGMSAGDVRALFRDAAMAAMRERMDAESVPMTLVKQTLVRRNDGDDLQSQQRLSQPSVPTSRPRMPSYRDRQRKR